MTRPKRTKPDSNQPQIIANLREVGCRVINVSSLPSYQIDIAETIQVRHSEHIEDPLDLFVLSPCWMHIVQAEVKTDLDAPFTPGQQAYFRSLDEWPPENPRGKPVIVAYHAGSVLNWFVRRCGCWMCKEALLEWRKRQGKYETAKQS